MVHEVGPQRAVGISGHRVFGYAYGWREHSTMHKIFVIWVQHEYVVAIATDSATDFCQTRQVRLQ